jgi:NitT/TauT family transport system permease protein
VKRSSALLSFASILAGLVVWQLSATRLFDSILYPSAVDTIATLVREAAGGAIAKDIAITLGRVLAGFALGSALGASLGLLMGSFRIVLTFFRPIVNFFRCITPIAWIAPATIWFGIGETSKLFLVVYATMFIVLINTMAGISHVHPDRFRMARAFGASKLELFRLITIPASVPFILTGMRIGLGNSFMTVIGVEMLAGNNGLGYLIYSSRIFYRSDVMFACIIFLGIVGFAADRLFVLLRQKVLIRYEVQPG